MKTELLKTEDVIKDRENILKAAEALKNGKLVAIPTETVYGLAANALDPEAVKNIFIAKGRPQDNPLIVHVACADEVAPLVEKIDPRFPALAKRFWPGALTVIMKKSALVPDVTSGGLDTVAVRCPSNPIANAIIKAAGVPLAAPSANTSGKPSPTRASHVMDDMNGKISMVVDGGSCEIGVESTVITLANGAARLLRPGGVTPEQLKEVLPELEIDPAVFEKLQSNEKAISPGMKYKHYSPDASVTLLKGSLEKAAEFVNSSPDESRCVLCFNGEAEKFTCPAFEYGGEADGLSQAANVFDILRKVDEAGFKQAYVRCPEAKGVGLAVYNRLLRSAAFKVVDLENDMAVIGLTGQTGAGKTTVCEYLEKNGFYIIDGDILAREAVKNKRVLSDLAAEFGEDIILPDGTLDRKKTASRAFASREKTERLNAITHPAITALTVLEIEKARRSGAKGAVVDAAALFESPIAAMCTVTAAVVAPEGERLKRIMLRDSITEAEARARMAAQYKDEYYAERADIIINNGAGDNPGAGAEAIIKLARAGK